MEQKRKGHRWFAALYDPLGAAAERGWLGERRAALLTGAQGRVVEIGAGTGANLAHYRDVEYVMASEPDAFMRRRLRDRARTAGVEVEILDAPAEALPLPDASADTAVSTLVLCTVASQQAALAELRRVLRPGGLLLFLEHVRNDTAGAGLQDRLERPWGRVSGGCHPNRATVQAIHAAGFLTEQLERDDRRGFEARFLPLVWGTARA